MSKRDFSTEADGCPLLSATRHLSKLQDAFVRDVYSAREHARTPTGRTDAPIRSAGLAAISNGVGHPVTLFAKVKLFRYADCLRVTARELYTERWTLLRRRDQSPRPLNMQGKANWLTAINDRLSGVELLDQARIFTKREEK